MASLAAFSSTVLLFTVLLLSAEGLSSSPGTTKTRLRFFTSGMWPYAHRAWIALEASGADYEKIAVDLQDKPQDFVDLYARANPIPGARAKVPLLQIFGEEDKDSSTVLCESLIVAEYIAERYSDDDGCGLLPPRPEDRAVMRLFTELCGSSFSYFPLLRARGKTPEPSSSSFPLSGPDGDTVDPALETFKEGLVNVDLFLTKMANGDDSGPFLFGERFSLAECNVAPFLQRACTVLPAFTGQGGNDDKLVNPMDLCDDLGLERLKRWIPAVLAHPAVIATGAPKEDMIKSTSKMLARFAAMEK
jgi:glutathione S-transferase